MKINFLGDSITWGVGASVRENSYVMQVGDMLGCEVCNFGASGTRIAKQHSVSENPAWDEHFMLRAVKMGEADFVFVFGGTNDYGHGDAMFGKPGDKDTDTFCGAFFELASYLVAKYGREKLCYILPIPRYNQASVYGSAERKRGEVYKNCDLHTLAEYIAAAREILDSLGVSYMDIADRIPEPDTNGASVYFTDGLHPNDAGHKIIAEAVCDYVRGK